MASADPAGRGRLSEVDIRGGSALDHAVKAAVMDEAAYGMTGGGGFVCGIIQLPLE